MTKAHDELWLPQPSIAVLDRFVHEPCIHLGARLLSYADLRRRTA